MSIQSNFILADNNRLNRGDITQNTERATDYTSSKIMGVRGSGLGQVTPDKSSRLDGFDRSQRFRSTGQKQISSDGKEENWFNFNQQFSLKPKFDPDMLAQSLFGSNFQHSTPQQTKQVTTLAYIKNQQIIDEIKRNLPIFGSERKSWRKEESRLVKPQQWVLQQPPISPSKPIPWRIKTPPNEIELMERIVNNKTEFASHQLSYLTNIQKEIELLHNIKVIKGDLQSAFITDKQSGLTPAGVLLIASSSFEGLLKEREFPLQPIDIKRHMEEASFVFRRILIACSECPSKDCTCVQNSKMTETLSVLWSYIVTAVDMALHKQETRIKVLEVEQGEMVKYQVTLFRDAMEREMFGKERQLGIYFKEIEQHKETIQQLNNDILKLNDKLQLATDLFQKLRDPQGMSDFRNLTEDLAKCVGNLERYRGEQYDAIEEAVKLMETCEKEMNMHHKQEISEEERRDLKINELIELQEKLQEELNRMLVECGKPKVYHIHKRVNVQQMTVNNVEKFQLPQISGGADFSHLAFKPAGMTKEDYAKLREQIYYEMQEKLIPALEADLVGRFKEFVANWKQMRKEHDKNLYISAKCQCGKEFEVPLKPKQKSDSNIKTVKNSYPNGKQTQEWGPQPHNKKQNEGQGPYQHSKQTHERQVHDSKTEGQEWVESDDEDINTMLDEFLQNTQKARRIKFGYKGFSNIEQQWSELQKSETLKQVKKLEIQEIKKTKQQQKINQQIGDNHYTHISSSDESDTGNEGKKHSNSGNGSKRGDKSNRFTDISINTTDGKTVGKDLTLVKSKLDLLQDQLKMKQKLNPAQVANNPILIALSKVLKNPAKLDKEYFFCMLPSLICSQTDQIMQDKTYRDIENETSSIDRRIGPSFPSFMYDSMLMAYGLQNISVKMIVQMTNGLMNATAQQAYGSLLARMLGLREPSLRSDEARIVIRAHTFFKMIQNDWINKTRTNNKTLEITAENEYNLNTGGECSVFEILNELKNAVYGESFCEAVMLAIKPDILQSSAISGAERDDLSLNFSILKITNKIAKSGKDVASVFKQFDRNNDNALGWEEIYNSLRKHLFLYFSREEVKLMTRYLDEDNSGEVDLAEFQKKVTFMDYQKQSHVYLISEINFINAILGQWYIYRGDEKEKLIAKIKEADKSGDASIQLDEFTALMHTLDSELTQSQIVKLWQLSIKFNLKSDTLNFDTLATVIQNHKIGEWGKEFFSSWLDKQKGRYRDMKKKKK